VSRIRAWWNGERPLAQVFWNDAVLWGTLANLIATGIAFAMIVMDWPGILALAVHVAPLPYNILMVVAVWRSAEHYRGDPRWITPAQVAIILWAAVMFFV
jgi:hypothetical protein